MPHRFALTLMIVVIADVVAWLVTVHATLTYHAGPAGPSVMSLGDLLGWIISAGLLIVAVLMVGSWIRRLRREQRLDTWMRDVRR